MSKFDLKGPNPRVKGKFTFDEYTGLEHTILETSEELEGGNAGEIDWDLLGDVREILKAKVRSLLGKEGKSETMKPLLDFTLNSYENLLMYRMLHGESFNNPWVYTNQVMSNGYLFLVSDDRDQIDDYDKSIFKNAKDEFKGNIGIVTRADKEKSFKGFIIDNRLDVQSNVLNLLKVHASGFGNAISSERIAALMKEAGDPISKGHLQQKVLLPLKRTGLVGSSSTGFFYITSPQDIQRAYDFHKSKYYGIRATMDVYEARAKKLGIDLDQGFGATWFY